MMHLHFYRPVEHPHGPRHYGRYAECRCGARKGSNRIRGHQPVDQGWIAGGSWTMRPGSPPPRSAPLPAHSWGEMTRLGYRWVENSDGMGGKWYPPPGSLPKLPQSAFNLETDR